MVAESVAVLVLLATAAAEGLHARRTRRLARLAFGPSERPRAWARSASLLRAVSLAALAWGLLTLWQLPPKIHVQTAAQPRAVRHLVLVLDVSPSMRLQDAGPTAAESRRQRAADVLDSFFDRVPMEQYRTSVVAVYNGAKPVVIDTTDAEVTRNILRDLPMEFAFQAGPTNLFAGLEEAARIAHPWNPRSTIVVLVSDGDTVPATGMPAMPAAVSHVLVVGIGDPRTGRFIAGRQSRQDTSTLRQIAVRLGGEYHDANVKHIPTTMIQWLTDAGTPDPLRRLTRREYALIACALGGLVFALLPLALHLLGTTWSPGLTAPPPPAQPPSGDRGW